MILIYSESRVDEHDNLYFLFIFPFLKMEISLFEIPDWLKNSEFISPIFKEIENYKIGTQEWLDKMSEKIPVKIIPPQSFEINNIKSFNIIMGTSDFFGYEDSNGLNIKYPVSIYAYAFTHKDEVLSYFRKKHPHLFSKKSNKLEKKKRSSDDLRLLDFFDDISNGKTVNKYRNTLHDYLEKYFSEFLNEINDLKKEFNFYFKYESDSLGIDNDDEGNEYIYLNHIQVFIHKNSQELIEFNTSIHFLFHMIIILSNTEKSYKTFVNFTNEQTINYENGIIELKIEESEF